MLMDLHLYICDRQAVRDFLGECAPRERILPSECALLIPGGGSSGHDGAQHLSTSLLAHFCPFARCHHPLETKNKKYVY